LPWIRHTDPLDSVRARQIRSREQLADATSAEITARAHDMARKARLSIKAMLSPAERDAFARRIRDLEWLAVHAARDEDWDAKTTAEREARERGERYDPGPHRPYW